MDLRDRPIPILQQDKTALDYHSVPIKIKELSDESLVCLKEVGIQSESYYARGDGLNAPYHKAFSSATQHVWVRKSIAEKLAQINRKLFPFGIEILALDGYRPIECQRELWDHFVNIAKQTMPTAPQEELVRFAGIYCSNPCNFSETDSKSWPTHATGGAIDLTLKRLANEEPLYMGGIFDDASEISKTTYYEEEIETLTRQGRLIPDSFREAARNRRLLYWSMHEEQFTNYRNEWWHFDWGTQMWIMNSERGGIMVQEGYAWYGLALRPD